MRKRAQIKSTSAELKQTFERNKSAEAKKLRYTPKLKWKKNWWIGVSLIGIFCMVLLLNTYFNATSDFAINPDGTTLQEKFFLAGPDPYYNMRLVDVTLETGQYPFFSTQDPLLNYPLGISGGRGPLLNMMAAGLSQILNPFMNDYDAIGYSMQFIPALFGALIIFPVYFIGKTLFGKKEGLLAAMFIALIPIHLGSGHGSAYALFDHDSFNLFWFFMTFLFMLLGLKEKDTIRSLFFGLLAGLSLAALTMTWVEAQFLYAVIALYAIVQMIIDIYQSKIEPRIAITLSTILVSAYLFSFPVQFVKLYFGPSLPLYLAIGVCVFSLIYIFLGRKHLPWTISLSSIFVLGAAVLAFFYMLPNFISSFSFLSPLRRVSEILYGTGIYGNKVANTIAEAGTSEFSKTWMSYGPTLLFAAGICFVFLIASYLFLKEKGRRDYLFMIILFIVDIWLIGTAGRFLNDFVPVVAILAAWTIWVVVDKIDYKQMMKNIKNAGGGFQGLRKGIGIYHILGILFVVFIVIMPNVILAFDSAIPSAMYGEGNTSISYKELYFGEGHEAAYGSGIYIENYWMNALTWLNTQDTEILDPTERPAVISWWDYGFYEVAAGGHPTVADNFQDGIAPAANFHIAKNETEAVAVWAVRVLEGAIKDNNGALPESIDAILLKYFGNESTTLGNIIEDPSQFAPSFNQLVTPQYGNEELRIQSENARYHDATAMIAKLSDENLTWFYHDIQDASGYSIRYYNVEGYDLNIFNIFTYLSDRGTYGFITAEDDYFRTYYVDSQGNEYDVSQLENMSRIEIQQLGGVTPRVERKDAFYDTMVYKMYVGPIPRETFDQYGTNGIQLMQNGYAPGAYTKHFAVQFISDVSTHPYMRGGGQLCTYCPAVVISKYYEGATVKGTLSLNNTPLQYVQVFVFDELGIPHDNMITNENGEFNVLVPAGNITIQFAYRTQTDQVVLEELRFNSTTNPVYAPITEDEATRKSSDYTREINISLDYSSIEGNLYKDINDNNEYDTDVDTPLSDVTMYLTDEFGIGSAPAPVTTDAQGHYEFTDLSPSKYTITAIQNEFEIHSNSLSLKPEHLWYNISKPKLGAIQGAIYFDANENGEFDSGEQMNDATVRLLYEMTNNLVSSMITDANGQFSFTNQIPGDYIINATKDHDTTGYYSYLIEDAITIEENETIIANISIDYAKTTVQGTTTTGATPVSDLSISFAVDDTKENNTAQDVDITSDASGKYETQLAPGYYIVSIDDTTEDGTFIYQGTLSITIGQGQKTYDIPVEKLSVTLSGTTMYGSAPKENITITFKPDTSVENNTAEQAETMSDTTSHYTVELMPGSYAIIVDETQNESGILFTYSYTGILTVQTTDTILAKDLVLTRVQQ